MTSMVLSEDSDLGDCGEVSDLGDLGEVGKFVTMETLVRWVTSRIHPTKII